MLWTLRSHTKINTLNPNLNVKMFNKGVQTHPESNFSVPFVPKKKDALVSSHDLEDMS